MSAIFAKPSSTAGAALLLSGAFSQVTIIALAGAARLLLFKPGLDQCD
jgi:hypothetical protein